MAMDSKYGLIDIPGVPDDEPIFILRGQDKSTPQTIQQYANNAIVNGSPAEHGANARVRSNEIRLWQQDHPDKIKAGD